MTDFKHVEEQIAKLRRRIVVDGIELPGNDHLHFAIDREAADTMQALLDVVRAANKLDEIWGLDDTAYADVERRVGNLGIALAKLKEQSDET